MRTRRSGSLARIRVLTILVRDRERGLAAWVWRGRRLDFRAVARLVVIPQDRRHRLHRLQHDQLPNEHQGYTCVRYRTLLTSIVYRKPPH